MARVFFFIGMTSWVLVFSVSLVFAETLAVIANSGADEVVRIVTDDESSVARGVDGSPYGVAITPDGRQVLVTIEDENHLAFIEMDDFSGAPFSLPVGQSPRGIAVDPTGQYAYVSNFEDDTLSEIRISSQTVVTTHDVKQGPMGVTAGYDEQLGTPVVYVANHLDDSVSVIDNENQTTTISVGDGPAGLAISPDNAYVFVANMYDDTVSIINTKDDTVVETVSVGEEPWGVAVGAQGKYVYVTNSDDNTVSVIVTEDFSIARTFRVGRTPRGVAAPRNGSYAYVVNQQDGSISRIETDDNSVTEVAAGTLLNAYCMGAFIGGEPPDRPGGLEVEAQDESKIDLTWVDNSDDETGFKIERSQEDADNFVQIATVDPDTTTYQDRGLVGETVYFYRIRSFNEATDSGYSASADVETMPYSGSVWCFIQTMSSDKDRYGSSIR